MKIASAPAILLVAGPTASGKSALAIALAERLDGEIVNADALQIYRDLRILTARPTPAEEARAPHHLFGAVDAADGWSVGHWLRAATERLAQIADRGRPAIVVGGTGLYLRALTRGLADIPPVPASVRSEVQVLFDRLGEEAFRTRLAGQDPAAAARIAPGDRQRLTRALEVPLATGRPLSTWQTDTRPALAAGSWRAVVIQPERDLLYARCDGRLTAMLDAGVLEEVRALMARELDPSLPALRAVGLRELAAHLSGDVSLAQAVAAAQQETRRYAKRQLTWLRNQTPEWPRLRTTADAEDFLSGA